MMDFLLQDNFWDYPIFYYSVFIKNLETSSSKGVIYINEHSVIRVLILKGFADENQY